VHCGRPWRFGVDWARCVNCLWKGIEITEELCSHWANYSVFGTGKTSRLIPKVWDWQHVCSPEDFGMQWVAYQTP